MNNKKLFLSIIIVIIMLLKINVEAASCTTEIKQQLKEEARAIQVIPVLDSESVDPLHEHTYSVNFINFSNKFYIVDSNNDKYEYDSDYTSTKLYGIFEPGKSTMFKIYGAPGKDCAYEYLTTVRVTFEYYNDYSKYKECEGIEDYALCKRNYSGTIKSEEWFYEQVANYRASLEETPEEPEEKNFFDKVIDFIKNNTTTVIVVALIIIVVVVGIVIIVRKKNKNKIKINLE